MMKRLLILLFAAVLLVACSDNEEVSKDETENKINIDPEEAPFDLFTFKIKDIEIIEEDDKTIAEIDYEWKNHTGKNEKMSLLMLTSLDVKQNGELLDETTGFVSDPDSRYYSKMPSTATGNLTAMYELQDDSEPITITIVPKTEEDSKDIEIELQ